MEDLPGLWLGSLGLRLILTYRSLSPLITNVISDSAP